MTTDLLRPLLRPVLGPLGRDLRRSVLDQASSSGLHRPDAPAPPVSEGDLVGLPEPARRYLRFMGVPGRPRDWSFLARFRGRFRRPGLPWMPCEAWQFNASRPVIRLFHMRIDFGFVLPMVGQDTYVGGRGAMHGRLLGLVPVADGDGPEFDMGELVTYLNDALVLSPSMLLTEAVTWREVDDSCFDITITDAGNTVAARVWVDDRGAMCDFSTEDRWCDLPGGLVRTRWTTPIEGWRAHGSRRLITRASAVWHLEDGTLPYIEGTFEPSSIRYDVDPRAGSARAPSPTGAAPSGAESAESAG